MFSYTNKILDVDLTHGKIETKNLDEKTAEKFVGGKGLGAKILYDSLKKNTNPLSPENIIIFATGPLTGTLAPSSARRCVVTKSPLTNIFLDSQVGGSFGVKMKKAGYDIIIVRGKSSSPVYLNVTDENSEIVDAENLWGKGCFYTEKTLKKELGKNISVASIGNAGEKLVRYACISTDMYRQAGRGGAGAVMGSKNLKAVAVKGNKKIDYAEPEKFKENVKKAFKNVKEHHFTPLRSRYGTPVWVNPVNEGGLLPTRNFQKGVFEHADEISGEKMKETIVVKDESCPGCPIKCWKHSKSKNNNYSFEVVGPEYETIALIGSNNMIRSIKAIALANQLCDDFGLDTISTGDVIAFASECSEKGLIKENIGFGDEEKLIELIKKIGKREDIGDLLAEGVKRISEKIGGKDFAMHVKGMEIPGYDPRGAFGMALAYATSDRGGCHQRAWTVRAELQGNLKPAYSTEGRARFVKDGQDSNAMLFSLVLCDFMPLGAEDYIELLNSAAGFDFTIEEYMKTGECIWNLTRMFNIREGITRKDDNLPKRFMNEPLPDGPAKGQKITKEILDKMLDEYYALRGWDENGIPKKEKLEELGLVNI